MAGKCSCRREETQSSPEELRVEIWQTAYDGYSCSFVQRRRTTDEPMISPDLLLTALGTDRVW